MKRPTRKQDLEAEFSGAALGDARLEERAKQIASRIAEAPADSFPDQMASDAELEALYRFLANPAVTLDGLLEGHVRNTHDRMKSHRVVRIVHDTTDFKYEGDREGLGVLKRGARGFFAHMALAVGGGEAREPLGVLAVRHHVLEEKKILEGRKLTAAERNKRSYNQPRSEKRSSRWEKLAIEVSQALPSDVRATHIMDQEADDYVLLGELHRAKLSFVVRGDRDRVVCPGGPTIAAELSKQPAHDFRTIRVSRRTARQATRQHPARAERDASLTVRWGAVTIQRNKRVQSDVDELAIHAVHVLEPNPPAGEEPIDWMLFTSERVESLDDATAVIDHYRARWLIEEFFKALKTGCAFEKRQLTTLDGLLRALGMMIPVAWTLLTLRDLGRAESSTPPSVIFDAEQLLLLAALLAERKRKLPHAPTMRDVMLGVAALGGHIKQNGDPGWIVLGRGLMKFLDAEVGWRLARRCDQS